MIFETHVCLQLCIVSLVLIIFLWFIRPGVVCICHEECRRLWCCVSMCDYFKHIMLASSKTPLIFCDSCHVARRASATLSRMGRTCTIDSQTKLDHWEVETFHFFIDASQKASGLNPCDNLVDQRTQAQAHAQMTSMLSNSG